MSVLRLQFPRFNGDESIQEKIIKTIVLCMFVALFALSISGQTPPPIIDMHLHASSADAQGPPPLAMCSPISLYPVWDNRKPYGQTLMKTLKQPDCKNPVWSPMTDNRVMSQTIEVMKRRNIYGV